MPNDLTTISTHSRPVSLFSASNEYLAALLNGRCDQTRLVDDLRDLLGLYFVPDETPEQRARQIALFVKDLADMSQECVDWAIEEWRRAQDRRPSPASLRQLCMVRRQEATQALRPIGGHGPSYEIGQISGEEKARRQAVIDRCAKAFGFVKHDGRYTLPSAMEEQKQERIPHWSETAAPDDPRFAVLRRARAANPLLQP